MFRLVSLLVTLAVACAFRMTPSNRMVSTRTFMGLSDVPEGLKAPPGMKPGPDGTFIVAGEHPKTYVLENDNKAKAIVDTHTARAVSWVDVNGIQVLDPKGIPHCFPDSNTLFKAEFVPEERAKKLSFDRMIFKALPNDIPVEYRVDVTMRADCLEYDIILMNLGDKALQVSAGVEVNLSSQGKSAGYKVTDFKGFKDNSLKSGPITLPVGKFKETKFYFKISK